MGRSAWWVVARREFLERVRSKWFLAGTILGPILLVALIVVPALIARSDTDKKRIHVVAHTDDATARAVIDQIAGPDKTVDIQLVKPDTPREELLRRVRDKEIEGFLILPANLLDGGKVEYQGVDASNFAAMGRLRGMIDFAVIGRRIARVASQADIDEALLQGMTRQVPFETKLTTGDKEGGSGSAAFFLGYIVAFVLYMAILLYAIGVMRSVLLEKTNRVVEIVVSSIKPSAFMAGKIGGVGTVGLLQLGIWALAAAVLFKYKSAILGFLGASGASGFELPPVSGGDVTLILVFFTLGYFLYASLYAAVGAMCSTEQEAQQAQTPVVMLLVIPMVCIQFVTNNPRGQVSAVLTQIPFAAPVLMPMRFLLGGATGYEIALCIGILVLTTALLVWLAARIYRVGILSYGKKPTFRELVRWVKHN